MNTVLLVVGSRNKSLEDLWKRVAARDVDVIQAGTQRRVFNQIERQAPDFMLLRSASKRLITRRFLERVRVLAPGSGLIGLTAARSAWELSDLVDDIIAEPLLISSLFAAMQRVSHKRNQQVLEVGPLTVDLTGRRLWVAGEEFRLTPKQCKLVEVFMRRPEELVTRKELMAHIWDTTYLGDTRTLDVHIHWLRSMIRSQDDLPVRIETIRGHGYRLHIGEAASS